MNDETIIMECKDNSLQSIQPIYSSKLKNSYYLEEDIVYLNDKHKIKKFVVEDQPNLDDIVSNGDNYTNNTNNTNNSYNNFFHNSNTRNNFYRRTNNHCYTIPVFYSINDISKNIKNTIVRIFNKVCNSIKKLF